MEASGQGLGSGVRNTGVRQMQGQIQEQELEDSRSFATATSTLSAVAKVCRMKEGNHWWPQFHKRFPKGHLP